VCGLPPKGGYGDILKRIFSDSSVHLVSFPEYKAGEIYAYYITIIPTPPTQPLIGHAVSIFKAGGWWYLYDNEHRGALIPITQDSNWFLSDFSYNRGEYIIGVRLSTGQDAFVRKRADTLGDVLEYHMKRDQCYVFTKKPFTL
jgi:hypothetical protein